jgi:toxin HigB-1
MNMMWEILCLLARCARLQEWAALAGYLLAVCTVGWYTYASWDDRMIVSFRDVWLRAFFVEDIRSRSIPSDLESRLFRKLQMIDDATADQDLRVPPSNHFEKLRGNLAGFHSIRVNRQWRLVFQWDGSRGEATGLYLDDHSYR